MRFTAASLPWWYLLSLPFVVAWLEPGLWVTLVLVVVGLLWHWVVLLAGLRQRREPELLLETLPASHFSEKVRWSLDRLGVPYDEQADVGTLGVFFRGRTVPRLRIRTGVVTSVLGDSPAILRYLWGRYHGAVGERADFLRADADALALEADIDRYGVWLQQWVYHHILRDRRLTLHVWGVNDNRLPRWQRWAIRLVFPVNRFLMRKIFQLGPATQRKTLERIDGFLGRIEQRLADGRQTLLDDTGLSYVDITFASLSGLWVWPPGYGGGRADRARPSQDDLPPQMQEQIARWKRQYPLVTGFVEGLYRDERG